MIMAIHHANKDLIKGLKQNQVLNNKEQLPRETGVMQSLTQEIMGKGMLYTSAIHGSGYKLWDNWQTQTIGSFKPGVIHPNRIRGHVAVIQWFQRI